SAPNPSHTMNSPSRSGAMPPQPSSPALGRVLSDEARIHRAYRGGARSGGQVGESPAVSDAGRRSPAASLPSTPAGGAIPDRARPGDRVAGIAAGSSTAAGRLPGP